MRRYTLVFHDYIGFGSYVVHFKRVYCKPQRLKYYHKHNLHFVITGWPKVVHPDGTAAL